MEGTIRCRFLDVAAAVLYPQRQLIIGLAMMALPEGLFFCGWRHCGSAEGAASKATSLRPRKDIKVYPFKIHLLNIQIHYLYICDTITHLKDLEAPDLVPVHSLYRLPKKK